MCPTNSLRTRHSRASGLLRVPLLANNAVPELPCGPECLATPPWPGFPPDIVDNGRDDSTVLAALERPVHLPIYRRLRRRRPNAASRTLRTFRPPVYLKTWPACTSTALRKVSLWVSSATRMASGAASQRRVDPSISVNKNVATLMGRRPRVVARPAPRRSARVHTPSSQRWSCSHLYWRGPRRPRRRAPLAGDRW